MTGANGQISATLLLVEDEILIRMVLADDLRMAGLDVVEAFNGEEGLALFDANPDIRLVISDIRVPGAIDGVALTETIKRKRPDIPVILVSAHLPDGRETVADRFLRKPCDHLLIIESAREMIGTRR